MLATTIESNRDYPVSCTVKQSFRAEAMKVLHDNGFETWVTIEPVLDFDITEFTELIKSAAPNQVNIGADSKGHNLPEPQAEKLKKLIKNLEQFTVVKKKRNLNRLMDNAQ